MIPEGNPATSVLVLPTWTRRSAASAGRVSGPLACLPLPPSTERRSRLGGTARPRLPCLTRPRSFHELFVVSRRSMVCRGSCNPLKKACARQLLLDEWFLLDYACLQRANRGHSRRGSNTEGRFAKRSLLRLPESKGTSTSTLSKCFERGARIPNRFHQGSKPSISTLEF